MGHLMKKSKSNTPDNLAEQQSQKYLDAYKSLINQHAIVALSDKSGKILDANEHFCEISGYRKEELIGKDHRILNSGQHDSKFFKSMWQKISSGGIWQGEIKNKKKNGQHYWVNTSISPIYDRRGNIEQYLAIRYDITAQKFQSRNLQKINKIQHIFIESEFDNPKQAFNVLLEELLDITESEYGYIGKVLYKEDKPYLKTFAITDISWNEETRTFYKEKAPEGLEFYNLDTLFGHVIKHSEFVISNNPSDDKRKGGLPPGHPALNTYLGIPIFYGNQLIGSVGIANRKIGYDSALIDSIKPYIETCSLMIETLNNQERHRKLQKDIETSEKVLKATIENSYDGYWDWHITKDHEYMSPKFWDMFGIDYKTKKSHSSEWHKIIEQEDLAKVQENFKKHVETKGKAAFNQTLRFRHSNGSTVWIIRKGQVIQWDEHGAPVRMVGTHTDISSIKQKEAYIRKSNEEMRLATQRANAASRAKTDFLANMSHEIRTPMNGVIGFTELLKESGLNEQQLKYTNSIEKSGQALVELINDILDYTKIESGNMELSLEPTKILSLVDDVFELFSSNIDNKPISMKNSINNYLPSFLEVDAFRLKQILINLVGNAYKFTAHGQIEVTCDYDVQEKQLQVKVKDTGIGIEQGKIDSIFNSFQQADITTTKKFGGTGLGLAISQKLAILMGGQISCESELGQGSIFTLKIKATEAEAPTVQKDSNQESTAMNSNINILIVEDNEINQHLCETFLKNLGYSPLIASDGSEAVSMVEHANFDLILMDIRMPGMDGYTATKKIRSMTNLTQPTIYALTANAFDEDKQMAFDSGMNGFLSKPIKGKDLKLLLSNFKKAK